jgi:hypothetical protein
MMLRYLGQGWLAKLKLKFSFVGVDRKPEPQSNHMRKPRRIAAGASTFVVSNGV